MTAVARSDAFMRFAAADLPSNAERAIYPVLAGAPDHDWTPEAVAAAAGVSHHEADQALRRFASAGIVGHSHNRLHGHHYRWHPDMAYLREGGVTGSTVDPVCGMPVGSGSPHTALDGDLDVSFCSLPCLVRWTTDRRRRRGSC